MNPPPKSYAFVTAFAKIKSARSALIFERLAVLLPNGRQTAASKAPLARLSCPVTMRSGFKGCEPH
jgi:hypothetical protein